MRVQLNRKGVALGLVVGMLGGAAGGALATGAAKSPPKTTKAAKATAATPSAAADAFLSDVAGRLGVTVDQLKAALQGAAVDQVNQAVKDGKLTQTQADAIIARINSGDLMGAGLGRFGLGGRHGGGMMGIGRPDMMSAAATYLGLTQAQLLTQLQSGKSLADVAKAQGKTVSGLEDALVASFQKALDANTSLTAAQKAQLVADFKAHVANEITETRPAGAPGMMGGGMMRGAPMMGGAWH